MYIYLTGMTCFSQAFTAPFFDENLTLHTHTHTTELRPCTT